MATGATVGESQLQRIIRDLNEAVAELAKEYRECGEPITDDSTNLHKFSYKLEYLLQFDQKEKTTFLGTKKDYWDYFSDCLAKIKGANDGIRFVKSITELKTPLGKGRAFIRYSLVHQRLAETLQQCLMNQRVTSDWYYARSPFLKPHLSVDIINHLYELNEVQFDVASRGHDLDASWPTFARRTLGSANSPGHMWKPPSRSSSINSLASTYSQQAPEFPSSPDYGQGLLNELNDSLPACTEDSSTVEDLRMELDQSELRQRELLHKMQQLGDEAAELRGVVVELQRQLDVSLAAQEEQHRLQGELKALRGREEALSKDVETLRTGEKAKEAEQSLLQAKLATAERKNIDLLAKLDGVLNEKGQQAASYFDSAQKIHELLDRLKEAEEGKMEAVAEAEEKKRQAERLEEELKVKEAAKAKLEAKVEEMSSALDKLQGDLTLREKEASNLQRQLQDLQRSLEEKEKEIEDVKRKAQEHKDEMQEKMSVLKDSLETEVTAVKEQLKKKEAELALSYDTLQKLETKNQNLATERNKLTNDLAELEAALRASEKQLRGQLDDTKITVDEKDKRLREENRKLDESLQRATLAAELSETTTKRLEKENQSLREEQDTVKAALSHMQSDLKSVHGQIGELEKNLGASRKNEASLQEKLQAKEAQLEGKEKNLVELQSKLKALEKELEIVNADTEATCARQAELIQRLTSEKQVMEKSQLEKTSVQAKENQEVTGKLTVVQGQLEMSMKEVSRIQAEILDIRVQAQRSEEEKLKSQAQLKVTEAQRDELRTLTEQLKAQTETLNKTHISEVMEYKNKEETLIEQRDREVAAHAELAISAAAIREELATLKAENDRLVLENNEIREGLHRANTEMAELGITICKLSSEKEEAREHWAWDAARIEEMEKEVEKLEQCMTELRSENNKLRGELTHKETLSGTVTELQEQLEKAKNQVQSMKDSTREEMDAVKFQMSSEMMNHQIQMKSSNEQLDKVKAQLQEALKNVSKILIHFLSFFSTEEAHLALQKLCEELKQKLNTAETDKKSQHLTMTAEIDDLNRTKTILEERLIELIRDKDELWQKSDALEFEQKLRAEERWWLVDKEATHCLGCQGQFTWWLRRHHCRLCGRIFCYYCSNNFVMTKHSGKKERCCRDCYTQHNAVVERFTEAELSPSDTQPPPPPGAEPQTPPGPAPYKPTPRVTGKITTCSLEGDQDRRPPGAQATVPLSIDDISQFGDGSRELFIKSSCYSLITVAVGDCGPTIGWMFSSEPKSISFSVVYQESSDTEVEKSKVLIPLTRCNSHKETIQGQLKVRHPGLYQFIFDNSFSRFISKKVFYHLTVERPVIYDGSDFP
uniref:FYVE and coiled-coil domain-containing protein 1 n=1 Tax=Anabas testudineus TaxID=64144 RepID=A0A7N6A7K2_ANATE